MKVFVFAHQLVMGGSTINAIELAATIRDLHGHDVVLFATPGRMIKLVEERRLRFIAAPDAQFHPTLGLMRALREAVRVVRPDVVHAWEWWQCVDAYYSVHLPMQVPLVVSDMSMSVTRLLPKTVPTTWGTPELVDRARGAGRRRVGLLLPPVDVHLNAPDAADPRSFRAKYGLKDSDITLVTVSRLAAFLKGESLRRTIDAVRTLGRDLPVRLVIVGDGDARAELERQAQEVNEELGRAAVLFTGMLLDPRPAFAAADIVIGMGTSALRGMAFGKPAVIVGEHGFSAPFTPETADRFYYMGMYGLGDGSPDNGRLISQLRTLAEQRHALTALGEFSREFVVRHFSLEQVSATLAAFYRDAVFARSRPNIAAADAVRTALVYLRERRFRNPSRSPHPDA